MSQVGQTCAKKKLKTCEEQPFLQAGNLILEMRSRTTQCVTWISLARNFIFLSNLITIQHAEAFSIGIIHTKGAFVVYDEHFSSVYSK